MVLKAGGGVLSRVVYADAADVPWVKLHEHAGFSIKSLYESDANRVGLMQLEPDAVHPPFAFGRMEGHLYVVAGTIILGERSLTVGCYACVPPGQAPGAVIGGPDGGTLLYHFVGGVDELAADHEDVHDHPAPHAHA